MLIGDSVFVASGFQLLCVYFFLWQVFSERLFVVKIFFGQRGLTRLIAQFRALLFRDYRLREDNSFLAIYKVFLSVSFAQACSLFQVVGLHFVTLLNTLGFDIYHFEGGFSHCKFTGEVFGQVVISSHIFLLFAFSSEVVQLLAFLVFVYAPTYTRVLRRFRLDKGFGVLFKGAYLLARSLSTIKVADVVLDREVIVAGLFVLLSCSSDFVQPLVSVVFELTQSYTRVFRRLSIDEEVLSVPFISEVICFLLEASRLRLFRPTDFGEELGVLEDPTPHPCFVFVFSSPLYIALFVSSFSHLFVWFFFRKFVLAPFSPLSLIVDTIEFVSYISFLQCRSPFRFFGKATIDGPYPSQPKHWQTWKWKSWETWTLRE